MLKLDNLTVQFDKPLFINQSLKIKNNCVTLIVGQSGCGKTTLLYKLGLIDFHKNDGNYYIDNIYVNDLSEKEKALMRRYDISFVFQDYMLYDHFDIYDNLQYYATISGEQITEKEAKDLLHKVHLHISLDRMIYTLSSGQRQRLAIACSLIKKSKIDIIAIGNGTASRESEAFVADTIKEADHKVEYILVSEAGASVYSASKLAIEEYPDLHVEQRSAISIARRLQDPLSELVKIDPESIGVGMYQHDVAPKKLSDSLGFVVTKSVNNVGVNINTASSSLLKYVSGLTKTNINKLLKYRSEHGKFQNREEIKKLLTPKTYTQSVGFLRIPEGTNILDATSIHPESYDITLNLLKLLNLDIKNIGTEEFNKKLDIDIAEYAKKLNTDVYTLEDIVKSLQKPNRDPRDDMPKPLLKSDVLHLEDLKPGMKLQGTVRNVTPFGAFIDIGIKNDGLAHISKLTNRYIKHPSEVVSVGDIVDCYVDEIYPEKHKVSLSLINPEDSK